MCENSVDAPVLFISSNASGLPRVLKEKLDMGSRSRAVLPHLERNHRQTHYVVYFGVEGDRVVPSRPLRIVAGTIDDATEA